MYQFLSSVDSMATFIFPYMVLYFIIFCIFFFTNEKLSDLLKIGSDRIDFTKLFLASYFFVLQILPSILIFSFGSRRILGTNNIHLGLVGVFITLILTYLFFSIKYKSQPIHKRWVCWILMYQTLIFVVIFLWVFNA